MQMQRIVMGKSGVSGWGAFLHAPARQGDLLGEYTGELISQAEADRRCDFSIDLLVITVALTRL